MTDVALLPALEHVISIHVPMKGTTVEAAVGLALNEFQSSCPVRGTTQGYPVYKNLRLFQSSCRVRARPDFHRLLVIPKNFNPRAA